MNACAITGPRPTRFQFGHNENDPRCVRLKEQLRIQLVRLYEEGVRLYYTGGALGVDMWAAEILLHLQKEKCPEIHVIVAIPFEGYDQKWGRDEQERMLKIRDCSETVIVCHRSGSDSYLTRNRYMVDRADCLLAVYDFDHPLPRSGTAMTIRYAQKMGLPTIFIQPNT